MLNKLDADDDWRVNIVWTDIKEAGGHNDIEKAGLSELSEQGGPGPGSYIYVKPGQTPGNVLIEIKSGKIKGIRHSGPGISGLLTSIRQSWMLRVREVMVRKRFN